ncbi:MAG TPA: F0F1 ATP synthase subunit B [Candidatus Eisenbacteria bacterium]|jgi:F-type H+-transporting ATPase subunit b|nr:F0F1 ATP synthase subunit B [Candidatus Eisenbacteria bacterium]
MNIIDVRQFATQIVGFLLVLFILGKYAWPPVLGFIEERRKKIADDLDHARQENERAVKLRADLEQELKGIEAKARARIQEAVTEGQRVASEIKAGAQKDVTQRLQRLNSELEVERDKAMLSLKQDLVKMTVEATEKILREKLDEKTQRRLVEEFIGQAGAMPGVAR